MIAAAIAAAAEKLRVYGKIHMRGALTFERTQQSAFKLKCTPFVRQYDILSNKWGVYYAKRDSKQTIHTRI